MLSLPALTFGFILGVARAESPPPSAAEPPTGDMGYLISDIEAVLDTPLSSAEARSAFERLRQILLSRKTSGASEADLLLGAMHGMLEAQNHRTREACSASERSLPPPAMLLVPAQADELARNLQGELTGIGIEFQRDEARGGWTVVRVLAGSPGDRAGLQAGDVLVSVNDSPLLGRDLGEVLGGLQGGRGSAVKLGLVRRHGPAAGRLTVSLKRDRFVVPSISAHLDEEGTGLLRIDRFTGRTPAEARGALDLLRSQGMERLVLDLRANPGGDLKAVAQTAGLLLSEREVLLRAIPENREAQDLWAEPENLWDGPVALLVDRWTRGVAEALAASLQEQGRATLIGEPTMGVARTETLVALTPGLLVRLDSVRLETGQGLGWDGQGVMPDVPVSLDITMVIRGPSEQLAVDAQLQTAVHTLKVGAALP